MRSARASYGSNAAMPRPRSRLPAMRDIAFVAFLFAFIGVGFRKPFLFILAYCYIDIVAPQRLSYFLINSIPISLIVFALAIPGLLTVDEARKSVVEGKRVYCLVDFGVC